MKFYERYEDIKFYNGNLFILKELTALISESKLVWMIDFSSSTCYTKIFVEGYDHSR